ncbi:MAG: beta strand repeat-containing protein, partial [Phycisphaerae bacterium]
MGNSRKSRLSNKLILGIIAASALTADPILAGTLPVGGKFSAGTGNISTSGRNITIDQSTRYGIINWKGFSIGNGNTVEFNNGSGATLNRVTGVNISNIDGMLGATGSVYLINPNGVVIGPGGKVLTNGDFIAATRDVSNQNFLQGDTLTFSGTSSGTVVNEGKITSTNGAVILIGQAVVNSGSVSAVNGTVGLAAGNSVLLQPVGGDQRVFVQTGAGNVSNSGQIKAAEAELRAADGNVYALAGNTGGLIEATGSKVLNGQVWLTSSAGSVSVSGNVSARNMDGSGGKVVATGNTVTVAAGAEMNADATSGTGGDVVIRAAGTATMDGTLLATGQTLGGHVETSGRQVVLGSSAQVNTTASGGPTGSWLIDPQDYTIASSGGDITGSQLSTELASNSITILSSQGATAGTGDINVNDTVSWSANTTLTLSAFHNVNVNSNITATGNSAGLVLTPDTGAGGGTFNLQNGAVITLSGSTPTLSIAGTSYTVVNSAAALQAIGSSGNYALGSNINVSSIANFSPIGGSTGFSGTLNGLGNTVSNLTINLPSTSNIGFIGTLSTGGVVENIGVTSGSVAGLVSVGGLVGSNDGTISNSYANVTVTGNSGVGGLVANNNGGMITNSYATGNVTASGSNDNYAGGLAGGNNSGTIADSYATGAVSGGSEVGGLVGQSNTTISQSYATGAVTGGTGSANVGGLVGFNTSDITDSYATGTVSGTVAVGGLTGTNSGTIDASFSNSIVTGAASLGGLVGNNGASSSATGTITDSYATGSVTASGSNDNYVGGLAGGNNFGSINNSYATGAVSGGSEVGGLIGQNNATVINTYATGSVTSASGSAAYTGGLVGLNTGSISYSYSTGAISGTTAYGGFAGGNTGAITDGYYDSTIFSGSGVGSNTGTGSATGLTTSILESALPTDLSTSNWANANNTTAPYLLGTSTVYAMAGNTVAMLIFTPSELDAINNNLSGNYALGGNIDLYGISNFTPIGGRNGFSGSLNGLGYSVSNLTINSPTTSNIGLISELNSGATLENISVLNGSVSGQSNVAILAGINNGSIINCFTSGAINDNNPVKSGVSNVNIGGLIGQNNGTVNNSGSSASVVTAAGWNVGGLVGGVDTGSINNSYASGAVSGAESVGGLVGAMTSTVSLANSYATGTVSGQSGGTYIGGLV